MDRWIGGPRSARLARKLLTSESFWGVLTSAAMLVRGALLWLIAVAGVLLCCCRSKPPTATPKLGERPSPLQSVDAGLAASPDADAAAVLVTQQQLDRIEQQLLARVARNRRKQCPRPPLRGPGRAGPSDPARRVFYDTKGVLGACLAAAQDAGIDRALALPRPRAGQKEKHYVARARRLDDPRSRTASVRRVARACAALPSLLGQAASFREACSLFLPGRRHRPPQVMEEPIGRAIAIVARAMARSGKVLAATRLVLDGLRLGQDGCRGGSDWLGSALAVYLAERQLLPLGALLLNSGKLSTDELRVLDRELQVLIAGEPHPGQLLVGDVSWGMLYYFLPPLKKPGWIPPGGWPPDHQPLPNKTQNRQMRGMRLVAAAKIGALLAAACPSRSSYRACFEAVGKLALQSAGAAKNRAAKAAERISSEGLQPGPLADSVRALLLNGAIASTVPALPRYIRHHARHLSGLAALRLLAAFHLAAKERGRCPRIADFARQPLAGLLKLPRLGTALRIKPASRGEIAVLFSKWVNDSAAARIVTARCRASGKRNRR